MAGISAQDSARWDGEYVWGLGRAFNIPALGVQSSTVAPGRYLLQLASGACVVRVHTGGGTAVVGDLALTFAIITRSQVFVTFGGDFDTISIRETSGGAAVTGTLVPASADAQQPGAFA